MSLVAYQPRTTQGAFNKTWLYAELGAISRALGSVDGMFTDIVSPLNFNPSKSGTNDSAAYQRAWDALGALGGGIYYVPVGRWQVMNLAPPLGFSYTVIGATMTNSILRPPSATPANPVYALTGMNGPAVRFMNHKIEGARLGFLESTGFHCETTNGVSFERMWFAGLLAARQCTTACTGIWSINCVSESCGQANVFATDPTECGVWGEVYFENAQDLQVSGDCSSFVHTGSISNGCTNTSVLASSASHFRMSDFVIATAAQGFQFTSSDGATVSGGQLVGCTTDFGATSTNVVFVEDVDGDINPLLAAGVMVGQRVGKKQRNFWVNAKPTTTAVQFYRGDRALVYTPSAASVAAWTNVTDSTVGVNAGNWRDEAALS